MDGEQGWSNSMEREQRRSRSRSPFDKNDKSRDSSLNRSSRQNGNNRSHSPRGKRTRAPTQKRVYVANIPYDCKWTTVRDLFKEKVGDVSYVELFQDESGKFRGCGIVDLKEASSVQKAVDVLHRYEFGGRQLVVKEDFDVDRDRTGKPIRGGRGGGDRDRDRDDYGRGLGGLGGSVNPQYNTYGLSPQFLNSLGIAGPLTPRIFVANLDYKVTVAKLEEVFKLAGKVVNIELKKDEEGNSKGHGIIEMGHPVEAVQAISMFNGQKFYNRTMSVKLDKKHRDDSDNKRLPEGLQSIGKGLGANGIQLQLSDATTGVTGLTSTGTGLIGGISGVASSNMGLMQNSPMAAGGMTGLGGVGMGLGGADRGNFGAGVGLTSVGQPLGLANTAAAGMTNVQMFSGGINPMVANTGAGLQFLGGGLAGTPGGNIGLGSSALGNQPGGSVGGYNDRLYDRGHDSHHNTRNSDTIIVRNVSSRRA